MTDKTQLAAKSKGQLKNNNLDEHVISQYQKTMKTLEPGKNATTMQGGMVYPIMYKEVLAGEYIKSWDINMLTRIITPLVPTLDKIYITARAYFVPLTAIWNNAEKAISKKAEINTNLDTQSNFPATWVLGTTTSNEKYKFTLASRYGVPNKASDTKVNMFLYRGYRKIWNDYLRNKEYTPKDVEWKDDIVTTAEDEALNPNPGTTDTVKPNAYYIRQAPARKNYFTNVKNSLISPDITATESEIEQLNNHIDWEATFKDKKQSVVNANKNDWDIIAEMGGTSPVRTDRVEFLGELDYELNYQQITQSAPMFDEASSPLGTTGSFSYTRANGTIFSNKQFKQHGHIHILVSVNMDQLFEGSTPKELMKLTVSDIYRPGLAKKESQLMLEKEIDNHSASENYKSLAYQPAWAEYNRLPSMVTGEMQSKRLTKNKPENPEPTSNSQWHNYFGSEGSFTSAIDTNYFMPTQRINAVLARNNIVNTTFGTGMFGATFYDDPILNMSEHIVSTALPINSSDLNQVEKAEERV